MGLFGKKNYRFSDFRKNNLEEARFHRLFKDSNYQRGEYICELAFGKRWKSLPVCQAIEILNERLKSENFNVQNDIYIDHNFFTKLERIISGLTFDEKKFLEKNGFFIKGKISDLSSEEIQMHTNMVFIKESAFITSLKQLRGDKTNISCEEIIIDYPIVVAKKNTYTSSIASPSKTAETEKQPEVEKPKRGWFNF